MTFSSLRATIAAEARDVGELKPKEGKEFFDFVRETAEHVKDWPECKHAAIAHPTNADTAKLCPHIYDTDDKPCQLPVGHKGPHGTVDEIGESHDRWRSKCDQLTRDTAELVRALETARATILMQASALHHGGGMGHVEVALQRLGAALAKYRKGE